MRRRVGRHPKSAAGEDRADRPDMLLGLERASLYLDFNRGGIFCNGYMHGTGKRPHTGRRRELSCM